MADPQWDLSQSIRFIQDLRLRHTYVAGGKDDTDLGINDTDVAVTFTLPNFLTTGQPLFISPAFALHLWDGPADIDADLPPNAYSAYLDFQWASDPMLQIGAELGFRIGVYTDFNTLNDDSLRIQGLGLGVSRLTPACMLKVGVMYLDRNEIKILPAGGLLWTPTPQVRFDFFFPQPKLSAYLTTVGPLRAVVVCRGRIWRRGLDDRADRRHQRPRSTSTTFASRAASNGPARAG